MIRRRHAQGGFAMLLVFVMAASIALMLYRELPRVAFEAQRNKEDQLIERGEQYSRAIQVYYRKFKKYPASLDELENTNNIRFLRRRYVDPMTGKNEWRLIHYGAGGFTDSLVHKPAAKKEAEKSVNTFTWDASAAANAPASQGAGFPAVRPSEQRGLPMPGQTQQAPADPNAPEGTMPQSGLAVPAGGQPQTFAIGQQAYPTFPGYPTPQGVPGQQPNTNQAGFPSPTGQPSQATQPGMMPGYPFPVGAGQQPAPGTQTASPAQPGATPGTPNNQALNLIQQILTTPRTGPSPVANTSGMQIIGGIAGVASTLERPGIKVYNQRDQYHEWEFLYDASQDKTAMAAAQAGQAGVPQQPGQPTQGQPAIGQPGFGSPGFGQPPFGTGGTPGFPGGSPFGQPAPGTGGGPGMRPGGGPGLPVTPRSR